jgi:hypothetical protein
MAAKTFNLSKDFRIEQGADYGLEFTVVDEDGELYDLSGTVSCAAQVRATKDASASIAFTGSVNATTSVVTLSMSNTVTSGFSYWSGYWDCELTVDGVVTRVLEGSVTISQQVTQ